MAFRELLELWKNTGTYPKGTSDRYIKLDMYQKLLEDTIYDVLPFPFQQEENGPGNYIDLLKRRPAVLYNMPKIIVQQTASLTFGEAHAPAVRVADTDAEQDPEGVTKTHETFEQVIELIDLDAVMLEAMIRGSVGSVAIVLRKLPDDTPYLEIIDGKFCTPFFDPEDPRKLKQLDYVYHVTAEDLRLAGYAGNYDPSKTYFIKVTYTKALTLVSLPLEQKKYEKLGEEDTAEDGTKYIVRWEKDTERSYDNPFSFLPVHYIRNLERRGGIDGECTFDCVKDATIEISYLLSQIGRGYRYTADPFMIETEGNIATTIPIGGPDPAAQGDTVNRVKSPARTLKIPAGGDAKYLEITAGGLEGAGKHITMLREYALEVLQGMKSEAKDEGGTQSGRALHLMHQALVWLVERFRTAYGQRGYLPVLRMVFTALQEGTCSLPDIDTGVLDPNQPLRLMWPPWSTPSGDDMKAELEALSIAAGSTNSFPKAILPDGVIAQKAAAIIGISDQSRVAAQLMSAQKANPPVTPRDQLDTQVQIKQMDLDAKKAEANKPKPPSK